MSTIATELLRIQNAKAAIETAIENKGVNVPPGSTIDEYATLIDQISGGGGGNLTTLNVTPSTQSQQITPSSPYDGYNEVNVAAVTSDIDPNITAGNIKKNVTILGVTGTNEGEFDFVYRIKRGEQNTISAAEGAVLAKLTPTDNNTNYVATALYYMFYSCPNLISADLSAIKSLDSRLLAGSMFGSCINLTSVNLDNLTIIGNAASSSMFVLCSKLISASFPLLTSIHSPSNMFDGCKKLETFSAPLLATLAGGNFGAFFRNCNSLREVTIHPNMLSGNTQLTNILGYATSSTFTKLRLSANATNNVYLSWQGSLDSNSILDVLNHLSTEVTGKTCAFNNLTVNSSDPNYAAIVARKNALTSPQGNWSITGLTL